MFIRPAVRNHLAAAITLMFAGILAGGRPLHAQTTCSVLTGGYPNYGSIQAAVNDSNCATIKVAPGRYYENISISRDVNIVGSGQSNTTISPIGYNPGIGIHSGSVKIDSLTILWGSEGIANWGSGKVYILNCEVRSSADAGVYTLAGFVQIEDSTVSNSGGINGAIYLQNTSLNLVRSTIQFNQGPAISPVWMVTASNPNPPLPLVTISNSTIAHNGYGINGSDVYFSIFSSTIANNGGVGLYLDSGHVNIKSSIIANNALNCAIQFREQVLDEGNNLLWPATDTSCAVASFGKVGDPNLSEFTVISGWPNLIFGRTMMPSAPSAAIGTGACSDLNGAALVFDERLYRRPASGCDIGAVESRSTTSIVPDAAWWKLDEASGTTAHDSSAHGVNGTVYTSNGAPPWTHGQAGGPPEIVGSLYTGAFNAWVATPIPTTQTDNLTFTMWVNCGGCNSYPDDFVLFYNGEFRWDGYGLYVPKSDRHLVLIVNGYIHDFGYMAALPMTNTWTYLAVVRSNGEWQLYVNGKPVDTPWNHTPNTPVGHASIGADTYGGGSFGGFIDDVRVYNHALSAAEIAWLASRNQ
jgi:hypothetical protein